MNQHFTSIYLNNSAPMQQGGGSGATGATPIASCTIAPVPNNPLNVEVSLFSSYQDTIPKTVNLLEFLQDNNHKAALEAIRQEPDKAKRDVLKAQLPAITVSGVFTKRSLQGLVRHSGLIAIDVDYKGNERVGNYQHLKDELAKIPYVAYCSESVSGRGFFVIIPLVFPDKHRQQFAALERNFKHIGLNIDSSCKDISRLRGYSYDPAPYINPQAKPYPIVLEEKSTNNGLILSGKNSRMNNADSDVTKKEREKVVACIHEIVKREIDITSTYERWFSLGCSLANTFGEEGRSFFQAISQFHPSYCKAGTDFQFDKCLYGYSYTLGTFFHYCKLAGVSQV